MDTPVNTDVIVLTFLGYGYGDSLIKRVMDPRSVVDKNDQRALAFMVETGMLEVRRIRRAYDYFTWRREPHDVALKVKGTNHFLERVIRFLSGQFTIDVNTWQFLVMSGFIKYYRPSNELDIQIDDADEDVQNPAGNDEDRSNSAVSSPNDSPVPPNRENSPSPDVPRPAVECEGCEECAIQKMFGRHSQADSESEAAEAQAANVEHRDALVQNPIRRLTDQGREPEMEADPEPSAESSPEPENPVRGSQDSDVMILERVTESFPQYAYSMMPSHMPPMNARPQMASTSQVAPIRRVHQPVREAPYRLLDGDDSAYRYRQQNQEIFDRRLEQLSDTSKFVFD
ncbi:unnamed protein product [Caenorhabditis brenneri]